MTILVGGLAGMLATWSVWALVVYLIFVLIGALIIMLPMALLTPMYLFEEQPFFETLQRAFRYGMSFWIEIFGVLFVFGLIGGIINGNLPALVSGCGSISGVHPDLARFGDRPVALVSIADVRTGDYPVVRIIYCTNGGDGGDCIRVFPYP